MTEDGTILVTGATGYVGARLVTRLLAKGYRVRATGRSLARLRKRPWANRPGVELFPSDAIDPTSIAKACEGCAAANYLVHSMMPGDGDFEEKDREAARTMARAGAEVDFWRVVSVTPQRELRLLAEMKLPGEGVLAFRLRETSPGTTQLTQTAQFLPRGLGGMAYWVLVAPFHRFVFPGLLREIARRTGEPIVSGPQQIR